MKYLVCLFFLGASVLTYAQSNSTPNAIEMPVFKNGDMSVEQFIADIDYTSINANKLPKNFSPSVHIAFVIDTLGAVTNAEVYKSSNYKALDKLVLEYVSTMPNWQPTDKPVRMMLPFRYNVN